MTTTMTLIKPETERTDDDQLWDIALSKDTSFDGVFVICVKTTGIYCRPSCTARQPLRKNVTFLPNNEAAEAAGFRACKRCKPRESAWVDDAPALVSAACELIDRDEETLTLPDLAAALGCTTSALNSAFRRVIGVTAQQYNQAKRLERLKEGLRNGASVTHAMYDAGYGSSSRLYEKAHEKLGMSPGKYRLGAPATHIAYAIVSSSVGLILIAATEKGVCSVKFGDDDEGLQDALRAEFPRADIERDGGDVIRWVSQISEHLAGLRPRLDVPLDVQGTAFQWRVWRALQEIAYGETKSYKQVATELGNPKAVRAVARACATNHVAVIIPCHRVIGSDGSLTGYAYGVERKAALLEKEFEVARAAEGAGGP